MYFGGRDTVTNSGPAKDSSACVPRIRIAGNSKIRLKYYQVWDVTAANLNQVIVAVVKMTLFTVVKDWA